MLRVPRRLARAIEAVLSDEPRPGAPGKFTPEQVTQIWPSPASPREVRPAHHPLDGPGIGREVIRRGIVASISPAQVYRYLREAALQPHKSRYWLNTTEKDPARFEEQVKTVCDTYLAAPSRSGRRTHTVSVDEMTGMQALERNAPSKPMIAGKCERIEFEYTRHGTLCLIGNFVVTTGELLRPTIGPTRTESRLRQPHRADGGHRPGGIVGFVVDNLNIHCSESLVSWWPRRAKSARIWARRGCAGC